mmetsp:Transcript_29979/g.56564  ORF Transcript_29979/g.56564 Transcript_29979/m.56564 type:complete len:202 (+) Transcript_29979:63-668(+)
MTLICPRLSPMDTLTGIWVPPSDTPVPTLWLKCASSAAPLDIPESYTLKLQTTTYALRRFLATLETETDLYTGARSGPHSPIMQRICQLAQHGPIMEAFITIHLLETVAIGILTATTRTAMILEGEGILLIRFGFVLLVPAELPRPPQHPRRLLRPPCRRHPLHRPPPCPPLPLLPQQPVRPQKQTQYHMWCPSSPTPGQP